MSEKIYPFKKNGRFYFSKNHRPESLLFGTIPAFLKSLTRKKNGVPDFEHHWLSLEAPLHSSEKPVITWIGHSTFLIQVHGINILTDPIFGKASMFYPRMLEPGIALENLPPIDAVAISHNHYDHMDATALTWLKKRDRAVHMLVPHGDKKWFTRRKFSQVTEFDWEQSLEIRHKLTHKKITCTFVPADHWSRRGLFDQNKSLWGGWVIQAGDTTIYFAGDTAYSKECFSRIAHVFPNIDVALMPIGPGEPREWMKHSHVNAHEAGEAFLDLNAQHFIPMHWGTFAFGDDYFEAPLNLLKNWWKINEHRIAHKKLHVIKAGQRFIVPQNNLSIQNDLEIFVPTESVQQLQK